MVGFQDSINLVKESLREQTYSTTSREQSTDVDHDKILRDYDNFMREHERRMEGHKRHVKRHREDRERDRSQSPKVSSMRFRFKSDGKSSRSSHSDKKRKHRSRDYENRDKDDPGHSRRYRTRSPEIDGKREGAGIQSYSAHPLPRPKRSEYLDPAESASVSPQPTSAPPPPPNNNVFEGPDHAFRSSLFDAMADDEGAAYWEGVYGEPIHVYTRPTVQTKDGLEQMNDDQYAAYVKQKMWEKKNPELVQEREDRARRELEEEEKRNRRREGVRDEDESGSDFEWVGNEEKGYERRRVHGKKPRSRERERGGHRNRGFMNDVDAALARGAKRKEAKKWQQAWATYRQKWQHLKENPDTTLQGSDLANAIPWPVLSGSIDNVSRENMEDFFRNYTLGEGETRTGLLKAERFRWHPDKIQHRFGGENVDAETLKLVTSVFQTIDELMAQERRREGKD